MTKLTKQLHCFVPDKIHESIRKESFKRKISMSKLMIEAWQDHLDLSTDKKQKDLYNSTTDEILTKYLSIKK